MGENTAIEWATHTFNPWIGCTRVSPGCRFCYAEARDQRFGDGLWGKNAPRRVTSDANWRKPLAWDRAAAAAGRRDRVFCASLADVFEAREDLHEPRRRLWGLIDSTPNLDWLLLTKRPENIYGLVPWNINPWPNVWLGTTVEDQERADERVPVLLEVPATVRFLSCEPLIGPVTFGPGWLAPAATHCGPTPSTPEALRAVREIVKAAGKRMGWAGIDWVICGGESGGKHARPMHPAWARRLRDQCTAAGVPFLFKQWGSWAPTAPVYPTDDEHNAWDEAMNQTIADDSRVVALQLDGRTPQGEGPDHRWCDHQPDDGAWWMRYAGVSGKSGGRELDGRTWDEFPEVRRG